MSQQLTAVRARWTLLPRPVGGLEVAEGVTVLVRGNRIADVVRRPFGGHVDQRIELPSGVLLPGIREPPQPRDQRADLPRHRRRRRGAGSPGGRGRQHRLQPAAAGRRPRRRGAVRRRAAGGLPARDARAAAVGHHQRPRHAACGAPLDPRRRDRARAARVRRAVRVLGSGPRRRQRRPTAVRRHRRGRLPRGRRSPSRTSTTRGRAGGSGSGSDRTPPTPARRACCAGSPTWPASATRS